jgi:hypothetical protein
VAKLYPYWSTIIKRDTDDDDEDLWIVFSCHRSKVHSSPQQENDEQKTESNISCCKHHGPFVSNNQLMNQHVKRAHGVFCGCYWESCDKRIIRIASGSALISRSTVMSFSFFQRETLAEERRRYEMNQSIIKSKNAVLGSACIMANKRDDDPFNVSGQEESITFHQ